MRSTFVAGFLGAVLGIGSMASTQEVRYELGRRMRAFEVAFAPSRADIDVRRRVCPHLERAVRSFFALRLDDAAQALDEARLQLLGSDVPDDTRSFGESLALRPEARLVDLDAAELGFELKPFYRVEAEAPDALTLRLHLTDEAGKMLGRPHVSTVRGLPHRGRLPLEVEREGDHRLVAELYLGRRLLARAAQGISVVRDLDRRLAAVAVDDEPGTLGATRAGLFRTLRALARRRTLETDMPAHRMLVEAERLSAANAALAGLLRRPGEHRLWLETGRAVVALRMRIPDGLDADARPPVVVALHGAGGSENLFFDGYGAGAIVRLCERRKWLLLAPRSPGMFGATHTLGVLDALEPLLGASVGPVFVVGHSMGAVQAVAAARRAPERFSAVVALGGGGRIDGQDRLGDVAFLVAAGARDFGAPAARALHRALEAAGAQGPVFREYEATEHLGIVQIALDDVFEFLDRIAARSR